MNAPPAAKPKTVVRKLMMTLKYYIVFFGLAFLASSCSTVSSKKINTDKSWLDSASYPKQRFYGVTLFVLDDTSQNMKDAEHNIDTSIFDVFNDGYGFVNNSGKPKTKSYHSFKLDSTQIVRLEHILTQQPCTDSMHFYDKCSPIYRNVFVFYDEDGASSAIAHVCFQCQKTHFNPDRNYMLDFDDKGDYTALKNLTDSIKHNR